MVIPACCFPLLLSIGLSPAQATTPVIHAEDNPSKALGKVMVETGLAPDQLRAVTVAEYMTGHHAQLVGAGEVASCAGAPTGMAEVNAALEEANGALAYMEHDRAQAALKRGKAALGCLTEPIAPDLAARLHYLSGLAAYESGDKATAWSEYFRAHIYDANLAWDEQFAPASEPIFDLAGSEVRKSERVTLELLPPFPRGSMKVDGHDLVGPGQQLELHPGEHILQILGEPTTTLTVTLDAHTKPLLVVPEAMPADAATWAARAELRPTFSKLLTMVEKDGQELYVTALDGLWKTTVGSEEWTELVTPSQVAHLMVTGIPAGSQLTITPADGGTPSRASAAWDQGELDERVGLPIQAEHRFENLANGPYVWRLEHPLLGSLDDVVVVAPGETTTLALDWPSAPGFDPLRGAYAQHLEQLRGATQADRARKVGRTGLAASGALFAGTAALAIRGLFAQADVSSLDKQYQDALARGDATAGAEYWEQREDANRVAQRTWIGAGSLGVATGVGVAFGFGQLGRAKKHQTEIPSWDPQQLELALPVAAPAAQPPDEPQAEPPVATPEEAPAGEPEPASSTETE